MTDQSGPDTGPTPFGPPDKHWEIADEDVTAAVPESMLQPINGAFLDDVDEPAQADTGARAHLRDQIADALYKWAITTAAGRPGAFLHPRTERIARENALARADAVLPVVQAALAEQTKRSAASWVNADYWRQRSKAAEVRVQETLARAEQAEDRARKNLDAIAEVVLLADEQQQRAVAAEALLRDLIDPDDCHFDHHGGCQAHGYLDLKPGEKCPHAEAKELLAALDQPKETE